MTKAIRLLPADIIRETLATESHLNSTIPERLPLRARTTGKLTVDRGYADTSCSCVLNAEMNADAIRVFRECPIHGWGRSRYL